MLSNTPQPQFLVMDQYHLSQGKARAAVIAVLERCGEVCPRAVVRIQRYLDKSDSVFGGMIDEISVANYQMSVNTAYAGWEKQVTGPCRTSSVVMDLTEDILEYRACICKYSNEHNFRICCRYYRAYLSACLSLVDAFINRHILVAEHDGFSSPEFDRLKRTTSLEDRVCLLLQVCSEDGPSQVLQSIPWCHFQEIRKHRNEIIHAINPVFAYSLKEMWQVLNKVRTGIDELLLLLRHAHKKPTLLFIEQLRSAPTVNFQQIRFRADGNHVVKTLSG